MKEAPLSKEELRVCAWPGRGLCGGSKILPIHETKTDPINVDSSFQKETGLVLFDVDNV